MAFGTETYIHTPGKPWMFQSLFFWNGLWDSGDGGRRGVSQCEFQSLFFWNGLWDSLYFFGWRLIMMCFNPCFSGMPFGTRRRAALAEPHPGVSILVFLEWPLGLLPGAMASGVLKSVSILVFLEWPLGREVLDYIGVGWEEFQSLFFWNGLWDRGESLPPSTDSAKSFNPCFSGMAFGTRSCSS